MNQVLPRHLHAGRGRPPAADVRLVLILHAHRLPIERRVARWAEVEDELVAVVEKPAAVDRLVVANCQVVLETSPGAGQRLLDGDRLDPVNRVLQVQMRARRLRHVHRRPRVGWLGADVEEQRPVRRQDAGLPGRPIPRSMPDTGPAAACRRRCDSGCPGCTGAT